MLKMIWALRRGSVLIEGDHHLVKVIDEALVAAANEGQLDRLASPRRVVRRPVADKR